MARIVRRLREYASEVAFARGVTRGVAGFARLVGETLLFHLANGQGRTTPSRAFRVPIQLAKLRTDIWLRRVSGDVFIFYEVLKGGIYHLAGTPEADLRVRCIIDCGGNIGVSALYFADRYPNARIISIEPLAENFELLTANVAAVGRIIPVWGCVSDTDGHRFFSTDQPTWGNAVSEMPTDRNVPAYTIETIMRTHGIDHVDILNVDIEGEEKKLFAEAAFLQHTDTILIELHEGYSAERFQQDVRPYGLTVKMYDPAVAAHQIAAVREARPARSGSPRDAAGLAPQRHEREVLATHADRA